MQWPRPMQDFVYGESQGRKFGCITPEFFSISCVAIAVENLTRRRRRRKKMRRVGLSVE